jgi:hypothetical protein
VIVFGEYEGQNGKKTVSYAGTNYHQTARGRDLHRQGKTVKEASKQLEITSRLIIAGGEKMRGLDITQAKKTGRMKKRLRG